MLLTGLCELRVKDNGSFLTEVTHVNTIEKGAYDVTLLHHPQF